jgi:hypothetical protein
MKIRNAPDGSGDRVRHFAALHEFGFGVVDGARSPASKVP